jgi:hypothetical protein
MYINMTLHTYKSETHQQSLAKEAIRIFICKGPTGWSENKQNESERKSIRSATIRACSQDEKFNFLMCHVEEY